MTRKDKDTIFQLAMLMLFLIACIAIIFWTMASAADESLAAKAEVAEQEPVIEAVAELEEIDGSEHDPDFEFVGDFKITYYCSCKKCCGQWASDNPKTASGTTPVAGHTVGSDWDRLPAGTVIYIDGMGEYTVEDKVANWVADKNNGYIIDVYCDSHEEAINNGTTRKDVWVLEW